MENLSENQNLIVGILVEKAIQNLSGEARENAILQIRSKFLGDQIGGQDREYSRREYFGNIAGSARSLTEP